MDGRRPMPRQMDWTKKDSEERCAQRERSYPTPVYNRNLYQGETIPIGDMAMPSNVSNAPIYNSESAYDLPSRKRLPPRSYSMENPASEGKSNVQHTSSASEHIPTSNISSNDTSMFRLRDEKPSTNRQCTPPKNHSSDLFSYYNVSALQSDHAVDDKNRKEILLPPHHNQLQHRVDSAKPTFASPQRKINEEYTSHDSQDYQNKRTDTKQSHSLHTEMRHEGKIQGTNYTSSPCNDLVDFRQLVADAFLAINEMKDIHDTLFDLSNDSLRYDQVIAQRADESMNNVVKILTKAKEQYRLLCREAKPVEPLRKLPVEELKNAKIHEQAVRDEYNLPTRSNINYRESALVPEYSQRGRQEVNIDKPDSNVPPFDSLGHSETYQARLVKASNSSATTDQKWSRDLKEERNEYLPVKAIPSSGRNMFADFDRKMQEIRDSLNAIASREAFTIPTTTPKSAPVENGTSAIKSSSFDEYFRAFKRDLASFSTPNQIDQDDNPAMNTPPKAFSKNYLNQEVTKPLSFREPYTTP